MIAACRSCLPPNGELVRSHHAGLLLYKYLMNQDDNGESKKKLLEIAIQACKSSAGIYKNAYDQWKANLPQSRVEACFKTVGRLVVGLGSDNVLETGLTLHHTYGVPIIPGTALKGLAAHYCNQVWGTTDPRFQIVRNQNGQTKTIGEYYKILFGDTEDSGHIHFFDAWICPTNNHGWLKLDVMTVHHPNYYQGDKAPTDFDDPTPIPFLSVNGSFHVILSCDVPGEEGRKWLRLTLDLLTQALQNWGIGGKTSSGYGQMVLDEQLNKKLEEDNKKHIKDLKRQTESREKGKQMESWSPVRKELEEDGFSSSQEQDKNQFLNLIKSKWFPRIQDEKNPDRIEVAKYLAEWFQKNKTDQWKSPNKKNESLVLLLKELVK